MELIIYHVDCLAELNESDSFLVKDSLAQVPVKVDILWPLVLGIDIKLKGVGSLSFNNLWNIFTFSIQIWESWQLHVSLHLPNLFPNPSSIVIFVEPLVSIRSYYLFGFTTISTVYYWWCFISSKCMNTCLT